MLAAKLKRPPITLGTQRGRFVHRHVANGVFGHMGSSRDFILLTMYACHPQQPPALAGGLATGGGGQKLLPGTVAAKVVRLAIACGVQSGGFLHGHSANRVLVMDHVFFLSSFCHCLIIPVLTFIGSIKISCCVLQQSGHFLSLGSRIDSASAVAQQRSRNAGAMTTRNRSVRELKGPPINLTPLPS